MLLTEKEEGLSKIKKEMSEKLGALGLSPLRIDEVGGLGLSIGNHHILELNLKKLKKMYVREENSKMIGYIEALLQTQKTLYIYRDLKKISHELHYTNNGEKPEIKTRIDRITQKQNLSEELFEHLIKIGYAEEVNTIKMKKVFSEKEAIESFRVLIRKINDKTTRSKEQVEKDLEERIRLISSKTGTQLRLLQERTKKK